MKPSYPTSFVEAKRMLGGKFSKRLSANTRLRLEDNGSVSVILHETPIVVFTNQIHTRIKLYTGGWHSVTTKRRINQCLPDRFSVYQKDHKWWVAFNAINEPTTNRAPFHEGITLDTVSP